MTLKKSCKFQTIILFFLYLLLRTYTLEADCFGYFIHEGESSLSKIDLVAGEIVGDPIPTDGAQPVAIAIAPNDEFAYVTNLFSNNVSKIRLSDNSVESLIPVPGGPFSICITPDGTTAIVSWFFGVSKINLADDVVTNVTGSILLPWEVICDPAGEFAYAASPFFGGVVVKIDIAAATVVSSISVGDPTNFAITPNGEYMYVINGAADTVSKINLNTFTIEGAPINVGSGPYNIAITPNGEFAYVLNAGSNNMSKIDLSNDTVVNTIPTDIYPWDIAVTSDGRFAFVSHSFGESVIQYDLRTDLPIKRTAMPFRAHDFALTNACSFFPTPITLAVTGTSAINIFIAESSCSNCISWSFPEGLVPKHYKLYRNNQLIATLAGQCYQDHQINRNQRYSYRIVAEDEDGNVIGEGQIQLKTRK